MLYSNPHCGVGTEEFVATAPQRLLHWFEQLQGVFQVDNVRDLALGRLDGLLLRDLDAQRQQVVDVKETTEDRLQVVEQLLIVCQFGHGIQTHAHRLKVYREKHSIQMTFSHQNPRTQIEW